VLCVPDVALLPVQLPDAVQLVALVEVHVNVDAAPDAMVVGAAVNVSDGADEIVTVAVFATEPPTPMHVNVKLDVAANGPVLCVPDADLLPDQLPDAMQLVVLVELQVSVDAEPDATLPGDAASVSVGGGTTVTVAVCDVEPPVPVQDNEYVEVVVNAPVLCVAEVALLPLQLPDAVQLVALVEVHVSVDAPPAATLPGDAVSVSVGAVPTVTVAVRATDPPAPVQVNVKFDNAASAPLLWLPEVLLLPVQLPEAVQLAAFVAFQVSVEAPPPATVVGFAVKVSVGAGATVTIAVCVAEPPVPVQFNEKLDVAVRAPVLWLPDVPLLPAQFPDAVQLVASVVFHVSVDVPCIGTVEGFADSDTVGF
jgi:hypothetical protein